MIRVIRYVFMTAVLLLSFTGCNELMQEIEGKCQAVKQDGTRCQNKATARSKYCRVHQKSKKTKRSTGTKRSSTNRSKRSSGTSTTKRSGRCKATTQSGKRCSRTATRGGYCTQHYEMR